MPEPQAKPDKRHDQCSEADNPAHAHCSFPDNHLHNMESQFAGITDATHGLSDKQHICKGQNHASRDERKKERPDAEQRYRFLQYSLYPINFE